MVLQLGLAKILPKCGDLRLWTLSCHKACFYLGLSSSTQTLRPEAILAGQGVLSRRQLFGAVLTPAISIS